MSDELNTRFAQAAESVKNLSKRPENDVLLRLYALYKQASEGDCQGEKPGMLDFKAKFKYEAWKMLAGTPPEQAMQLYIELVDSLVAADK
jgi:acyl-CoA-binding protein